MRVRAVAPATTANLGPGFDCLGAAIGLHLSVTASEGSGRWTVSGEGAVAGRRGPELIFRAAEAAGARRGELDIAVHSEIPPGRGLGSSGAAVAAGLLVGCALAGRDPDPDRLLRAGLPLEGHPDNLAPALYGGLVLALPGPSVIRFPPPAAIRPALLVSPSGLATRAARRALPSSVPLADAVANVARAAALVALLAGAIPPDPARLLACTEDLLHQPYRAPLMPATAEAIRTLRGAGVAAVVSGAGPSVLCLLTDETLPAFREAAHSLSGWTALEPGWDAAGARVDVVDDG